MTVYPDGADIQQKIIPNRLSINFDAMSLQRFYHVILSIYIFQTETIR